MVERQFYLNYGAETFAAEVQAINEAINDAYHQGVSELHIYLDSRLAAQALYNLLPRHQVIAEIKDLMKTTEAEVHKLWIRAHVEHNERMGAMAKSDTTRESVNVEMKAMHRWIKKICWPVPSQFHKRPRAILIRVK